MSKGGVVIENFPGLCFTVEEEVIEEEIITPQEVNTIVNSEGPILFKVHAQKGSRNIATPNSLHKVFWRIDAKGKAVQKNMGDVMGKSNFSEHFIAPRDGLYQCLMWANWKAERDLGHGKIEQVPLAADIFISENGNPPQQIGRGNGGCMFDLKSGDKLTFFLKNVQNCRIQVDAENTLLNIGSI
jgi:hypothetical protein